METGPDVKNLDLSWSNLFVESQICRGDMCTDKPILEDKANHLDSSSMKNLKGKYFHKDECQRVDYNQVFCKKGEKNRFMRSGIVSSVDMVVQPNSSKDHTDRLTSECNYLTNNGNVDDINDNVFQQSNGNYYSNKNSQFQIFSSPQNHIKNVEARKTNAAVAKKHHCCLNFCCKKYYCTNKFSKARCQEIQRMFWKLRNNNYRKRWIWTHVKQYKSTSSPSNVRELVTKGHYFIPDATGNLVKVCWKFFLMTLGLKCNPSILFNLGKGNKLWTAIKVIQMERQENHKEQAKFFIKSFIKKYKQYYKGKKQIILASVLVKLAFLNFRALCHGCCISYQEFKSLFHSVSVQAIANDFQKLKISSGLALLRKVYLQGKSAINIIKETSMGNFQIHNATVDSTLSSNLSDIESDKPCMKKVHSVIMQLDIEDDPVIITKNESDSDNENESEGADPDNSPNKTGSCNSSEKLVPVEAIKSMHRLHPKLLSPCKCKQKCSRKFSEVKRSQIHTAFWAIGDYREQKKWIINHVQILNLQKKPGVSNIGCQNNPTSSVSFFFDDPTGRPVPVCDLFFQRTLGLSTCKTMKSPCEAKHLPHPSDTQQLPIECCIEQHVKWHCLKTYGENVQQIFKSRQSIKKLHSDFLKSYYISSVSYKTYKCIFNSIKKLNTCPETSKGSKVVKQHSPVSTHMKVLKKTDKVIKKKPDNDATLPFVRRSSRQTRMQGSMAEDDLIEMIEDSHLMSRFVTNNDSKPNLDSQLFNICDEKPSQAEKSSVVASSKEESKEVFNKGSRKIKGRQLSHKVSMDTLVSEPMCKRLHKTSLKSNKAKWRAKQKKKFTTRFEKYGYRTDINTVDKKFAKRHSKLAPLMKKHRHPILPSCDCTRRKCIEKIPEEQRHSIHTSFWNLKSYKGRKRWLMKYVETRAPKCKAVTLIPLPHKKHGSKKYFFPNTQGAVIEVCRLFFLHTLGFRWDSVVDTIAKTKKPIQSAVCKERTMKKPAHELPEHIISSVVEYLEWVKNSVKTKVNEKREELVEKTESENVPGLKSKNLFADYKVKYKHLKFNLGYHSFRRIFLNFVEPENIDASDKDDQDHESSSADSDVDQINRNKVSDYKMSSSIGFTHGKNSVSGRDVKKQVANSVTVGPKFTKIKRKYDLKINKKYKRSENSESLSDNLECEELEKQTSEDNTANVKDTTEATELSVGENNNMNETEECILDVGSGFFKRPIGGSSNNNGNPYITELKYKKRRSKSKRNDGKNYPVLPPCKCTKRKCAEKFPELERKAVNDMFWGLDGYNERKQWILEHIKRADIKRRIASREGPPRKLESRWYYLPDGKGNLVDVCKAFFLRTLGYKWDSVIDTIGKTTPKGDKHVVPDRRGRKPPPHKISEEAVNSMTLYIESACQTYQPLYQQKNLGHKGGSKTTTVSLIPYGLTMKQLFEDYKSKHPNHTFGYESFRKVFKRVHALIVANLPPNLETEEESEPVFSSASRSFELNYLAPANIETKQDFNKEPTHSVANNQPFPSVNQYAPSPPLPQPQQQPMSINNPSERKSCLYQYAILPPEAQEQGFQMPENGPESLRYNTTEQDTFLKYKHSIYGPQANIAVQPGHFPQMSEPVGYTANNNPCPDVIDPVTNGAHNQFPSYFMPNAEPLRRQAYHQMASQYQTILHHIAESSRFFNYGSFPPAEATFQSAQEKPYHFSNRPEYPRDNIIPYNPSKHSQNYEAPSMPVSYSLNCNLPHTSSQSHVPNMVLSPYSDENDNSFLNDTGDSQNYNVIKDLMQSNSNQDCVLTNDSSGEKCKKSAKKSRSSKKAKNDAAKVKREKKMRPKSARNYGEHYPLLPPCSCKKKKCTEKFTESRRQQIHDLFWHLNNYNDRKQWMLQNIKREDCKRRRVDQPESTRKSESRWYYLPNEEGHQLEVCKDFFLRTLGYKWDSVIDTIRKTTPKGETSTRPDMRGKKSPAHKLSNEILKSVIQYIESMQQTAEPYNHRPEVAGDLHDSKQENNSEKQIKNKSIGNVTIPYGLTMKDLFDDYKAKHASHKIGYESFRRIFKALSNSEKILDNKGNEVHSGNDSGSLPF